MRILALIALFIFSFPSMAFLTGNALNKAAYSNKALFSGYIGGAVEASILFNKVCFQEGASFNDAIDLVEIELTKTRLEELNIPAAIIINRIISEKYPCNKH